MGAGFAGIPCPRVWVAAYALVTLGGFLRVLTLFKRADGFLETVRLADNFQELQPLVFPRQRKQRLQLLRCHGFFHPFHPLRFDVPEKLRLVAVLLSTQKA